MIRALIVAQQRGNWFVYSPQYARLVSLDILSRFTALFSASLCLELGSGSRV